MIRKLMASSALLALLSAGAVTVGQAQDDQTKKPLIVDEQAAAGTQSAPANAGTTATDAKLTPAEPTLASVFIGRSVYSSADPESDKIGDVNDLVVSEDGTITDAVVGVGGFLGIGEKNVAVPFKELKVVEGEGDIRLIYSATREQLEAAPALDRTAYDPIARYQEQQAAAATSAQGLNPPLAPTTGGDLTAAPQAGDQTAATETPPPATDLTAAQSNEQIAATETPPPANEQTAAPSNEQTAATETPPATDQSAAPTDEQTAANETPPATTGNVAFLAATADQVQASALMGHEVLGAEGESIGNISDLVFQREGETHAALIDVGGFLGVGEKTVAIPFSDLQFSEEEAGGLKVSVAMTKDQLGQLPAATTGTAAILPPAAGGATSDNMAATETLSPLSAPVEGTEPDQTVAAGTEQPAAPAAQPSEPEVAAGGQPMDEDTMTTGSVAGGDEYAAQNIAASSLIGAQVYGPDDSSLGKIGDVVFDKTGKIDGAVINVGGFLGIGAKPVAVEFGSLQIRQDENNTVTVVVEANKDQLDQAPSYEISMK